ncbi:MAG TPA: orotate phosphoribosyltransferase [Acidimicrobiaceae bacterium]|nr:orotate phosphoribosyltransferase [Acidimicrobiaceae bacterium]
MSPALTGARAALAAHLLEHSVRTGDFTLKSGRRSGWFIDAKQSACRPDGVLLIAEVALEVIADHPAGPFDAIGGLTMGADPVAFGIAALAARRGIGLRSFSVRAEAKDHGVEGRIAGALEPGDAVVVAEDVATRGTSALAAVAAVRAFGADPVLVLAVVDRGGTAAELAAAAGVAFTPLLTAPQLGFDYER